MGDRAISHKDLGFLPTSLAKGVSIYRCGTCRVPIEVELAIVLRQVGVELIRVADERAIKRVDVKVARYSALKQYRV